MVGIQTGLLEGGFLSLDNLLLLGLLHSDADLLVDGLLSDVLAAYSHGVHRGDLHAYLAAHLSIYSFEIEACDSGELVVEVVVGSHRGGLDPFVVAEFHFLTGFSDLVGDMVSHCASVEVKTLEFVKALYLCVEGEFEDFLGECAEGVIFGDEVGFAFEGSDSGEVAA